MSRTRGLLTALALVATALSGGLAAPAAADDYYPLDFPIEVRSMAVVPRLSLDDGVGWLTVRVATYSYGYTGFEVQVPAGDGTWSAPPVVPVPEMGVVCREETGPDLHYRCAETQGVASGAVLPRGAYQIPFRVEHSGHPDGLTGLSVMSGVVGRDLEQAWLGRQIPDSFPVHEQPHPRSFAEVALAAVSPTWDVHERTATVPVAVTVYPGETVTALDVGLPPGRPWRITGTNAARLGLQCFVRTAGPSVHCRPAIGSQRFPGGRYQLTVHLIFGWPESDAFPWTPPDTRALLTVDGDPTASYDDLPWRFPAIY